MIVIPIMFNVFLNQLYLYDIFLRSDTTEIIAQIKHILVLYCMYILKLSIQCLKTLYSAF